jgi:transposase
VPKARHAVVVLDQARWHTAKHLHVPVNISLLPLPPYSPELNPQEQVWQTLRADSLNNTVFDSLEHIIQSAAAAWNNGNPPIFSRGSE